MTDNNVPACPLNEQAVAWAVHALEPDEEIAVLLHLPHCPSCRMLAGDAEAVLAGLGAAVEQVEPPPALRETLMTRVAETPQRSGLLLPRSSPEPVPAPPAPVPAPVPAAVEEPAPRHRADEPTPIRPRPPAARPGRTGSWLSHRGRQLVAASLAAVALVTIGVLGARNAELAQERDAETAQAASLSDLVDQLDRPGTERALLARDDGSTVAAVVVADGQRRVFTIGLPANASDRDTYVLWGIATGSSPKALGTFDVASAADSSQAVGPTAVPEGFGVYAISLEPGRTAPTAPTTVVAKGTIQA